VPPGDPVALAAALAQLLSEPALGREMGARGRERVAARFRWEHVAERLEQALALAAAPPGSRRTSTGRTLSEARPG
jgi:glycosyltransferase involved in cell wall biosynthesis